MPFEKRFAPVNGKYRYHGFIIDKTTVPLGTIQDIFRLCEQVSIHCPSEELHSERGVEGQVSGTDLEHIVQDFGRHWSRSDRRHSELHQECG